MRAIDLGARRAAALASSRVSSYGSSGCSATSWRPFAVAAVGALALGASTAFAEAPAKKAAAAPIPAPSVKITPYAAADKAAVERIIRRSVLDMLWATVVRALFSPRVLVLWAGSTGGLLGGGLAAYAAAAALLIPAAVFLLVRQTLAQFGAEGAARLADLTKDGKSRLWIARDAKGSPIGCAAVTPDGSQLSKGSAAEVAALAVAPCSRHKGVGSELLIEALVACKEKGVKRVHLTIGEGSGAGIRLCEKAGFKYKETLSHARLGGLLTLRARTYARDI